MLCRRSVRADVSRAPENAEKRQRKSLDRQDRPENNPRRVRKGRIVKQSLCEPPDLVTGTPTNLAALSGAGAFNAPGVIVHLPSEGKYRTFTIVSKEVNVS